MIHIPSFHIFEGLLKPRDISGREEKERERIKKLYPDRQQFVHLEHTNLVSGLAAHDPIMRQYNFANFDMRDDNTCFYFEFGKNTNIIIGKLDDIYINKYVDARVNIIKLRPGLFNIKVEAFSKTRATKRVDKVFEHTYKKSNCTIDNIYDFICDIVTIHEKKNQEFDTEFQSDLE